MVKRIIQVYLVILFILSFAVFVSLPVFLTVFYKNDSWLFGLLITIPVTIGIVSFYMDKDPVKRVRRL